eukprot:4784844-Alexandrium_andersonii.AAC.1
MALVRSPPQFRSERRRHHAKRDASAAGLWIAVLRISAGPEPRRGRLARRAGWDRDLPGWIWDQRA